MVTAEIPCSLLLPGGRVRGGRRGAASRLVLVREVLAQSSLGANSPKLILIRGQLLRPAFSHHSGDLTTELPAAIGRSQETRQSSPLF